MYVSKKVVLISLRIVLAIFHSKKMYPFNMDILLGLKWTVSDFIGFKFLKKSQDEYPFGQPDNFFQTHNYLKIVSSIYFVVSEINILTKFH